MTWVAACQAGRAKILREESIQTKAPSTTAPAKANEFPKLLSRVPLCLRILSCL
jgi:hypothetical protein